jgi:hypothetical protein
MTPSFQYRCVLAAVLGLSAGLAPGQTENGLPLCEEDGSIPDGYNQCECQKTVTYRGEFRDVEREFLVQLPDGLVGIGGCSPGRSFRISLTQPHGGEPGGDFRWNQMWAAGTKRHRETFAEFVDAFAKTQREDTEGIHATDLVIDQPVRTSLSSLTAIHLKVSRTEVEHGKMVYKVIIANNPKKEIVYEIGMVSPASHYEKDHKLFEAVAEGFSYIPAENTASH